MVAHFRMMTLVSFFWQPCAETIQIDWKVSAIEIYVKYYESQTMNTLTLSIIGIKTQPNKGFKQLTISIDYQLLFYLFNIY